MQYSRSSAAGGSGDSELRRKLELLAVGPSARPALVSYMAAAISRARDDGIRTRPISRQQVNIGVRIFTSSFALPARLAGLSWSLEQGASNG